MFFGSFFSCSKSILVYVLEKPKEGTTVSIGRYEVLIALTWTLGMQGCAMLVSYHSYLEHHS